MCVYTLLMYVYLFNDLTYLTLTISPPKILPRHGNKYRSLVTALPTAGDEGLWREILSPVQDLDHRVGAASVDDTLEVVHGGDVEDLRRVGLHELIVDVQLDGRGFGCTSDTTEIKYTKQRNA